jgi:ABC-type multidrug transport system fused ATPase/permease subunit
MASDSKTGPKIKPRALLGVLRFMLKYPIASIVCLLMLSAIIAIDLILPQILGNAVTNLRWAHEWGATFSPSQYVLLFLSLVLCRTGIAFLVGPLRNRLVQTTLSDIRGAVYNAIQRLEFQYHDRASAGELISRSTTDVYRLQDFLFACLALSIDIVISLIVTVLLIFWIRFSLGMIVVGTLVPTLVMVSYYAAKLQPRWRKVHDLHGAMSNVVQENIAGVRVVKAFGRELAEVGKFTRKREDYLATLMETVRYWAARVPFVQFLFGMCFPLVLWVGGKQVIAGELLLGDLVKVLFYVMAIGYRMGMVGQFTSIVQNASASAERVFEIIDEPSRVKSGHVPLPSGPGAIQFENVSFKYGSGRGSLENISFQAAPGKTYAIVGRTGSGKSTLVSLIPRFYDPVEGRILLDGKDIRTLKVEELRRAVAVIFQETFLFSATIAENIAYGRSTISQSEIERSARAAQADEFIVKLEHGYNTVVGERGITLSGGQKQRIAIARAFLMDPRILILDDATASVDSRTEHMIQKAVRQLSKGRTTFIIAHRFSTVQHADHVFVLDQGRIVEEGPPGDLLKRGGICHEIFHSQLNPAVAV